ncbi:Rad1-domain-containing protein [Exidia glandulosa HHB12029]|uniref:Rad1-domain-containing protein n=1 Tax=Exidia glandulosa HHB12029 TaxID=1314781 RepID=A0A165CZ98_EXIGL|nr:Rad1-domain-containing protein [Exidia glandulosa HHB12029]
MSQPASQTPPVFTAALHDVRYFANILRGIHFSNRAVLLFHDTFFRVTVERARVLVADAYIHYTMFDEHKYTPSERALEEGAPGAEFEIPLNVLVEVLNIFGSGFASIPSSSQSSVKRLGRGGGDDSDSDDGQGKIDHYFGKKDKDAKKTGMRMSYAGEGHPLVLLLSEDATGPKTTCEIKTLEPDDMVEFPFDDQRKILKIIMKSSWLRDALAELDSWSCRDITFIATPPKDGPSRPTKGKQTQAALPTLRIHAEGTFGSTEMDYPNDREVLESFECEGEVSFTYKFSHIHHCLQALRSSSKTSLRIDDEGLLALQFMMPTAKAESGVTFIEFRCLPQENDP